MENQSELNASSPGLLLKDQPNIALQARQPPAVESFVRKVVVGIRAKQHPHRNKGVPL